ncbi:hypothetical protein BS17DRAFT_108623 [Gyrodon lividus]|nr:hypothetical protein BS17DRAFT_108623 [Gyrodon lividus]
MTIAIVSALNFQKNAKTTGKNEDSVEKREYSLSRGLHSGSKIFKMGKTAIDNKVHRTQPWERAKETTSPSLVNTCTNIQVKQKKKISRKVKSLKEDIKKLFKTPSEASLTVSSNKSPVKHGAARRGEGPAFNIEEQDVPSLHPSPILTASVSRHVSPGVCAVGARPLAQLWRRSEAITSLVSHFEYPIDVHPVEFVSLSCGVVEPPSPLSFGQLPTTSHIVESESDSNVYASTFGSNELHTIEEGNEDVDFSFTSHVSPDLPMSHIQEGIDRKPVIPTVDLSIVASHVTRGLDDEELEAEKEALMARSSSHVPLGASQSEAEFDAMWEAEFAAFVFDSGDIEEWTDEVEMMKQAKYDAHFAYAEKALAVPVPRLSSFFSRDSLADSVRSNEDDFIKDPSPARTQSSEPSVGSTLPADTSLATTVDLGDSSPLFLSTKLRGFRRVPKHEDLRNSQVPTTAESMFSSDLSCGSLDLPDEGLATVLEVEAASFRRSEKRRGLRRYFLSFEGKACSLRKVDKGKNLRTWFATSGTLGSSPRSCSTRHTYSPPRSVSSEATWTSHESQEAVPSSYPSHSFPSSPSPVWSCAKITGNARRGKRMTKESIKALKKRLDAMDIDPWY